MLINTLFGSFQALTDVSLTVQPGEKVVVDGPSCSGKSTLLRTINRLEKINSGSIVVDGHALDDPSPQNINKIRGEVGMVFQSFNLFRHMTALENLALAPIKLKKQQKSQAEKYAMELLDKAGMADKVVFMDGGRILEVAPPDTFFDYPVHERTRTFLKQIL